MLSGCKLAAGTIAASAPAPVQSDGTDSRALTRLGARETDAVGPEAIHCKREDVSRETSSSTRAETPSIICMDRRSQADAHEATHPRQPT